MAGEHYGYIGHWGDMSAFPIRGVTTYSVSGYAQRPFAGALHSAIFNTFRRVSAKFLLVTVPVGVYLYTFYKAHKFNDFLYTKAGRKTLEALEAA
ncbi:hypothetical protein CANCADRAFT_127883 [Tortispora caseinolytica NRRL Y-17796]|uniref:Cytochrome b-c1 complex subunit 8 n=1 Tax=Tortispora caseinolytica NRRL Y-17796 TaxID=767744 RepID=A0A1E4TAB5_9ASCO|nr:hypothetical protein CANCADRAFT_127883 [Tortispora caseinolytica NRRL Y-17796]